MDDNNCNGGLEMPYLSTFVYCEGINVTPQSNGQIVSLTNPQHVFAPAFVPGQFSFGVSFGILELDVENQEHIARYVFKDPKGKTVIDTQDVKLSKDNIPPGSFEFPEDMRGIIMNMDFRNIPFKEVGAYKSEVFVDGVSIGIREIKVIGRNKHKNKN
jgi:hypothetical protein